MGALDFFGATAHDQALGAQGALTGMVQGPDIAQQHLHRQLANQLIQNQLEQAPQLLAIKQLMMQLAGEKNQAALTQMQELLKLKALHEQTLANKPIVFGANRDLYFPGGGGAQEAQSGTTEAREQAMMEGTAPGTENRPIQPPAGGAMPGGRVLQGSPKVTDPSKQYEKRVSLMAQTLGIDLSKPLSQEDAIRLNDEMKNNPYARPSVTEIMDPTNPSNSIKVDARTGQKIGDAPRFSEAGIDYNTRKQTEVEFAKGKGGNTVRSFNVAINHLDTLGGLADALQNNDLVAFNRIGNFFAKQTGKSAPVSFEAAKKIVGDEIVKAIVGGTNALGDREEIAATINAASSPQQLREVIRTFQELMVGQLKGLEQQYQTGTKKNDFDLKLSPAARRLYRGAGTSSPTPSAGRKSASDRFNELVKQGTSETNAYQMLKQEGY